MNVSNRNCHIKQNRLLDRSGFFIVFLGSHTITEAVNILIFSILNDINTIKMETKPETVTMTIDELSAFGEMIVNRTLEKAGLISDMISLFEINKKHGPAFARLARTSANITWYPKGKSNRAGLECTKIDYDKFRFNKDLNIYKP